MLGIKSKDDRIRELAKLLDIATQGTVTAAQRAKITELLDRQEFALKMLLDECRDREADIKIHTMEAALDVYKTHEKEVQAS